MKIQDSKTIPGPIYSFLKKEDSIGSVDWNLKLQPKKGLLSSPLDSEEGVLGNENSLKPPHDTYKDSLKVKKIKTAFPRSYNKAIMIWIKKHNLMNKKTILINIFVKIYLLIQIFKFKQWREQRFTRGMWNY